MPGNPPPPRKAAGVSARGGSRARKEAAAPGAEIQLKMGGSYEE